MLYQWIETVCLLTVRVTVLRKFLFEKNDRTVAVCLLTLPMNVLN